MSSPPDRRARWYELSEAASLGIEMAVAIAIGAWGGRWLETNVTHWKPWTFYIGLTIGIGAAVNGVVRTARKFQRIIAHDEKLQAEEEAAAQARFADLANSTAPEADPGSQLRTPEKSPRGSAVGLGFNNPVVDHDEDPGPA
ncbi:MAG: AtpZ/AtpI family protein [Nannocystaceae bacterium]